VLALNYELAEGKPPGVPLSAPQSRRQRLTVPDARPAPASVDEFGTQIWWK